MQQPVNYNKLNSKQKKEVREQYITDQNNKCYYCKEDLHRNPPQKILVMNINWRLFPPGFLKNKIHLQHNHTTGMTEGAVHAYCNAVMWQYHFK